jgi:hypothetical protein
MHFETLLSPPKLLMHAVFHFVPVLLVQLNQKANDNAYPTKIKPRYYTQAAHECTYYKSICF